MSSTLSGTGISFKNDRYRLMYSLRRGMWVSSAPQPTENTPQVVLCMQEGNTTVLPTPRSTVQENKCVASVRPAWCSRESVNTALNQAPQPTSTHFTCTVVLADIALVKREIWIRFFSQFKLFEGADVSSGPTTVVKQHNLPSPQISTRFREQQQQKDPNRTNGGLR